jgi:CheY-like chemotaxis protein
MAQPAKAVLWVDDEAELLEPHRMFLQDKGFEVATATNAEDAIEMVRTAPVQPRSARRAKCPASMVSTPSENCEKSRPQPRNRHGHEERGGLDHDRGPSVPRSKGYRRQAGNTTSGLRAITRLLEGPRIGSRRWRAGSLSVFAPFSSSRYATSIGAAGSSDSASSLSGT